LAGKGAVSNTAYVKSRAIYRDRGSDVSARGSELSGPDFNAGAVIPSDERVRGAARLLLAWQGAGRIPGNINTGGIGRDPKELVGAGSSDLTSPYYVASEVILAYEGVEAAGAGLRQVSIRSPRNIHGSGIYGHCEHPIDGGCSKLSSPYFVAVEIILSHPTIAKSSWVGLPRKGAATYVSGNIDSRGGCRYGPSCLAAGRAELSSPHLGAIKVIFAEESVS